MFGEHMAERISHAKRKAALLVSEANVTYNAERVAQRRGLNLRTFTDREDALQWLSA
jgi:hypothetical protein